MHASHVPFSAQVRRYKHLAKKVSRLLKEGTFQLLSLREKRTLLTKLQDRLKRIGHLMPQSRLKGALAGIALLLGTASNLSGQNFAPVVVNPFGLGQITTGGYPTFGDLDGDGDNDMFVANGGEIVLHENTGSAQAPQFNFDNTTTNPFNIFPIGDYGKPMLVDMDNDGDLDLLESGVFYDGDFYYQENIGSATAPQFANPLVNPFGLSNAGLFNFAAAIDIDNDGDIDVFGDGNGGSLKFYENMGTPQSPAFSAPILNPFGLNISATVIIPEFGDIDGDGDYDMLYFDYNYYSTSYISYVENIGTPSVPNFNSPVNNPFGISLNGINVASPAHVDIDGDTDLDVFVYDYYGGQVHFYENLEVAVEYPPTSSENTFNIFEDDQYQFIGIEFDFSDANAGDQLEAVQITTLPSLGLLNLSSIPLTTGQIVQTSDLSNLAFVPGLNENGFTFFKFKVYDGSLWSVEDYMFSINVWAINDAPTSQDAEITASNDFPYVFEAADFPYTDVENQPLVDLKIVSLPTKGSLQLSGNAVTAGQNVPAAQVGDLSYSAIAGEFGAAYTSFDFQVSDGTAFSTISTMTINVLETSGSTGRVLQATVKLSPNPVSELLNIHLESVKPLANPTISVFNALGRTVTSEQLNGELQILDYQLNVSTIASGFYFVKIEAEGKTSMTKFVKK